MAIASASRYSAPGSMRRSAETMSGDRMCGVPNIPFRSTAPLITGATAPMRLRSAPPIPGGIQEFRNALRLSAHRNRPEGSNHRVLRNSAVTHELSGGSRAKAPPGPPQGGGGPPPRDPDKEQQGGGEKAPRPHARGQ